MYLLHPDIPEAKEFSQFEGGGVSAVVGSSRYMVGNARLMEKMRRY